MKDNSYFVLFYGVLFILFLWPLLLLKSTFINGDYWQQFFPWSFHYASVLEAGHWPYWTNLVSCGFPLLAEGQIGAYYLWHLASYFFLPFKVAYTWGIPVHVLAGGVGFYLYGQRLGLSKKAAALSAVLFSFSSAYGGCFYTTGTLRVLTWLPWCLWEIERKRGPRAPLLAVFFSQMWTAGFPQLMAYSQLYLLLLISFKEKNRASLFWNFFLANMLGVLLAFPQLAATAELARVSVRAGESVEFALWGSVFPPSLVSLVYPHWGRILRVFCYIGLLPLGFVFLVLFSKKSRPEKMHLWLALIFLLLSLGKYNFLYAGAVQALSLTFIRNPSKFLFFSTISLAVAAGFGFDRRTASKKVIFIFWALIALAPLGASLFLRWTESFWTNAGHRYVEALVSQRGGDSGRPLQDYYQMVDGMLQRFKFFAGYNHPWTLTVLGLATAAALLLWARHSGRISPRNFQFLTAFVVVVDLALYGFFFGIGFIGNAKPFTVLDENAAVIRRLKELNGLYPGNWAEWEKTQSREWLAPSANMLYSIPHAGGYSPLLIKRYYELTKDLGFVDSSLGRRPFSPEIWSQERPLLDLLGVRLILSDEKLDLPRLRFLEKVGGRAVYENESALPKVYAVFDWKNIEDKEERLKIIKNISFDPRSQAVVEGAAENPAVPNESAGDPPRILIQKAEEVMAEFNAPAPAIVVFQNAYYPRWRVQVDGVSKKLLAVNHALSGVWVEKGPHLIRFYYDDTLNRRSEVISLFAWAVVILLGMSKMGKRASHEK